MHCFSSLKEGPHPATALKLPFSTACNSAAKRMLSFASICVASSRERFGESHLLHLACTTSSTFIFGAFFGENALKIKDL